jgi:hypothetical protein
VKRSNGKYKVPISVEDALGMTPELYDEVCSAPVPEPQRELPELNLSLAAMFVKAQGKIEEAVKRRAKGSTDEALLAQFKGQYPPTVQRLMAGDGLAPGTGFHKIAMQLAITANALGKSADDLVESCAGLCANHQSDSPRYNSPRKRKEELRRMWDYTHDNPCYGFSRGGIRSLCDVDVGTSDLDGLSASVGIGHVPEDGDDEGDADLPQDLAQEVESAQATLLEGLMVTRSGIHKRTETGARTLSNIGLSSPTMLVDVVDLKVLGYEVSMLCDSKPVKRLAIPGKAFTSRSNLSAFCGDYGGIFSGTDNQAGVVSLLLKRRAEKKGRVVYAVHKEGLDVVRNPLVKDRIARDVIWVHPDKVVAENTEAGYKFMPQVASAPIFYADVHLAPLLRATPDTEAWLRALFNINSPTTTAQMLGWFVSSFHKQFYQDAYQQFPLLHPNGPAGCGKTMTTTLLSRLNYLTSMPSLRSCGSMTPFALKGLLTGSASIPAVLDEFKPAEMGPVKTDTLLQAFRAAYNQGTGSSGGMSKGGANSSFRELTEYSYSSPVVFLAESQEMQTAIVQRSLPVAFNADDAKAHTLSFNQAQAGGDFMPNLGALLMRASMNQSTEMRREALEPQRQALRAQFDPTVVDRQVFNLAVVLEGLNFLELVLKQPETGFGASVLDPLNVLKQAIWDHKAEINVATMTEPAKMMNDLALISRTEEPESEFSLREGHEYLVKDGYIELLMRESFVKYFSWCKRKGFTPYYANADAFMSAMGKFPPTLDMKCINSPLKTSGQARVFRFSLEKLSAEGVEAFRTRKV